MAATSVCMDTYGGRYSGACKANGDHIEMITEGNTRKMLDPLIRELIATIGNGHAPERVLYFRDGVSHGSTPKSCRWRFLI